MSLIEFLKKIIGCKETELSMQNLNLLSEIAMLKKPCLLEAFLNSRFKTVQLYYIKRWLKTTTGDVPIRTDIRNFIVSPIYPLFDTLQAVWTFNVQYTYDSNNEGYVDYWQFPQETLDFKKGDCEDSSILRVSLSRQFTKETAIALGFYGTDGHAFPVYWAEDKLWILEATSNQYAPIEVDLTTMTAGQYKINYIFNENNVWVIDGSVVFGKKIKKEFFLD
jgi:hypothetical protein